MEGVIMAYVLLDSDKIVIQKQGYAQTGFIEVADTVVCGMKQNTCLLYTSPSPRDKRQSRMPSSA